MCLHDDCTLRAENFGKGQNISIHAHRPSSVYELVKDVENDPARPGEILFVNHGDVDGVPNFTDGFDKFENTNSHGGGEFKWLAVCLPPGIDPQRARLKFDYPASEPNG